MQIGQGGIWRCRHRPFRRGSNWMLCAVMNVMNENSSDASAKKARMFGRAMVIEFDDVCAGKKSRFKRGSTKRPQRWFNLKPINYNESQWLGGATPGLRGRVKDPRLPRPKQKSYHMLCRYRTAGGPCVLGPMKAQLFYPAYWRRDVLVQHIVLWIRCPSPSIESYNELHTRLVEQ